VRRSPARKAIQRARRSGGFRRKLADGQWTVGRLRQAGLRSRRLRGTRLKLLADAADHTGDATSVRQSVESGLQPLDGRLAFKQQTTEPQKN
jgi:hypothetical protein